MRFTMTTISISSLLVLGGCIQDILIQGAELAPDSDTDTGTSTPSEPTPTTAVDTGAPTVTGAQDSEPDSGSGPVTEPGDTANDPPPTIETFDVSPNLVQQAGVVEVRLVASDDVVLAELKRDDVVVETFHDTNVFSYYYDVFSSAQNVAASTYSVEVRDAADQSADAKATLAVVLPPTGHFKCEFKAPDLGAVVSSISALRYTRAAIVAVGTRQVGNELKLTVWLLHPDTCQLLPGWPKSIADWSALKTATSFGAAVDVDTDGNIVVAGNLLVGTKPRGYVALLTPDGARIWERESAIGDEIMGVAAGNREYDDRVFVVGSRRTNENPTRTDGMIWIYEEIGDDEVFVPQPITLKAPFAPNEIDQDPLNESSEWVRAVVVDPDTGNALAVGERMFVTGADKIPTRAFTILVHPLGQVIGTPWTSSGPSLWSDAARSAAICEDAYVVGGWTRDDLDPNAKQHPVIFWVLDDGMALEHRAEPQLVGTSLNGIACDRLNRVVNAGTNDAQDAQVFAVPGPFGARLSYETGSPGDDGAGGVACDPRGFCAWGGYRTDNFKRYAVVRAHHP